MARQTFSWKIDWLISVLKRLKTDFDALNLTSGTYTPTLTDIANIDSSTSNVAQWLRVGTTINVAGLLAIDTTAAITSTRLGISLPVASNITSSIQCGGVAAYTDQAGQVAGIFGDAANDRAEMKFVSAATNNRNWHYIFTYQVL